MRVADDLMAYSRFGLGPRANDPSGLNGDGKAALAKEISNPATLLLNDAGLPDTIAGYAQIRAFELARRIAKKGNVKGPHPSL